MKKIFMLLLLGLFIGQPALAEEGVAKKVGGSIKKGVKKGAAATGKGLETAGQWIEKKVHSDK